MCIDLDSINRILEENSDPPQINPEDPSLRNMSQGDSDLESIQFQSDCLRNNSDDSDARAGSTGGSFYYHGNLELSAHDCSPVQTSSASFKEWSAICQGTSYRERVEIPSCSTASSFSEIDGNHALDHGDNLRFELVDDKTSSLFMNTKEEFGYKSTLPTCYFNLNIVISCAF
ncbi:hypothetical protein V6Z11_D06G148900 [Gossypium hirsutum]